MADATFLPYRDLDGPVAPEGHADFDPRSARRRWLREGDPRQDAAYVLYWMQMFRRTRSNAALDVPVRVEGLGPALADASDADLDALVASCEVDHGVPPSPRFPAGREAALERLERFLADGLPGYAEASSDPGADATGVRQAPPDDQRQHAPEARRGLIHATCGRLAGTRRAAPRTGLTV